MTARSKISPNSSKTGPSSSSLICFGIWPTNSFMASAFWDGCNTISVCIVTWEGIRLFSLQVDGRVGDVAQRNHFGESHCPTASGCNARTLWIRPAGPLKGLPSVLPIGSRLIAPNISARLASSSRCAILLGAYTGQGRRLLCGATWPGIVPCLILCFCRLDLTQLWDTDISSTSSALHEANGRKETSLDE